MNKQALEILNLKWKESFGFIEFSIDYENIINSNKLRVSTQTQSVCEVAFSSSRLQKRYGVFFDHKLNKPFKSNDSLTLQFYQDAKLIYEQVIVLSKDTLNQEISFPPHTKVSNTYKPSEKIALLTQGLFPSPCTQGNQVILNQLITWLKSQNYKIIMLTQALPEQEESYKESIGLVDQVYWVNMTAAWKTRPLSLKKTNRYTSNTHWCLHHILELNPGIKEVFVQYASYCDFLKYIPKKIKTICFTHDIQHRFAKELVSKGIDINKSRLCTRGEEAQLLSKANIVVAINKHEEGFLHRMLPDQKNITVGMFKEDNQFSEPSSKDVKNLLYIASLNAPNTQGLKYFLDNLWDSIIEESPNLKLNIVGTIYKAFEGTNYTNVHFKKIVPDLRSEYNDADLCLNLTEAGTGLKIKTIEAIMFGKAIISTHKGAEGIEYEKNKCPLIISSDWSDLKNKIIECSQNQSIISKLELKAREYSLSNLGMQHVYRELKESLDPQKLTKPVLNTNLFLDITELLNWSGHMTGIQKVLFEVAKNLESLSQSTSFVQFNKETNNYSLITGDTIANALKNKRVEKVLEAKDFNDSVYLNMGRPWHDLNYLTPLKAYTKTEKLKIVHFIYDVIPLSCPQFFGNDLPGVFEEWFHKAILASDLVITISEFSKQQILNFAKTEQELKVDVIRIGDEVGHE